MGGYDIFAAQYDSVANRRGRPENLGAPINTPDDDTYYRLAPDGSYAYLSSYRIGGYGEKDIYTINYIRNAALNGQVFTKADSIPIPGVELIFSGLQADKRPISYRDMTKPDSGAYAVQVLSGRKYQVQLSRDGEVIETQEIEVPVVLNDTTAITQNFYIEFVDTTCACPWHICHGACLLRHRRVRSCALSLPGVGQHRPDHEGKPEYQHQHRGPRRRSCLR